MTCMGFLNPRAVFQPCVHHDKRRESKSHYTPVPVMKSATIVLCSGEVSSLLDGRLGWSDSWCSHYLAL